MAETDNLNSPAAVRQQLITRPIQWGVGLAVLIGFLTFLTRFFEGPDGIPVGTWERIPALAILMVVPTFTLLVGVALRILQLNTTVTENLSANARLSKISDHIDEPSRFDDLVEIAKSTGEIRSLSSRNGRAAGLIEWRRGELIAECKRSLSRLASGELVFSDPEEEWALNARLLDFLKPSMIRAISRNDENFWRSKVGKAFLDEQKNYLAEGKNRQIQRIFVLQEGEEYNEIIKFQIEYGISVKTITEIEFGKFKIKENDFVIYEDLCLRTSKIIGQGKDGLPELKDPDLSLDTKKIAEFSGKFDRLWLASDAVANGAHA